MYRAQRHLNRVWERTFGDGEVGEHVLNEIFGIGHSFIEAVEKYQAAQSKRTAC
jgi:hypothetical protein